MPTRRIAASAVMTALVVAMLAWGPLASPAAAGTLPTRTVVSKVVKNSGRLVFKGKVEPEHANKNVWIQRKKCKGCAWKFYAKVKSDDTSHYKQEIKAPRRGAWFWRAKVVAYGGYDASFSGVWKTYVK